MPVSSKTNKNRKISYRVRTGLVVQLTDQKTFVPGEIVEMSPQEYMRHKHQVETEEQYQARQKLDLENEE